MAVVPSHMDPVYGGGYREEAWGPPHVEQRIRNNVIEWIVCRTRNVWWGSSLNFEHDVWAVCFDKTAAEAALRLLTLP